MSTPAERGMAAGFNTNMSMFDEVPVPDFIMDQTTTMRTREVRADDIILGSYPKSGTHWVWEILNMIIAGKSKYAEHWQNSAFLECRTEEELNELDSPRVLHTHLHSRMLPDSVWRKKCKIVYVQRDPKDCLVSCYAQDISQIWTDSVTQHKKLTFTGTGDAYLNAYLEGSCWFGSWFDHVTDWNNIGTKYSAMEICVVQYEDLKKDCVKEIKKMAEYLERPLSDKICSEIAEACSFKTLKYVSENVKDQTFHIKWKEGSSGYFRKGQVGDWKNWLTVAQNERFNRVYEETLGHKYHLYGEV